MSGPPHLVRSFLSRLLGIPLVALVDFDYEVSVRLVRRNALGFPYAVRMGFVRKVYLRPNGTLVNGAYVDQWVLLRDGRGKRSIAALAPGGQKE